MRSCLLAPRVLRSAAWLVLMGWIRPTGLVQVYDDDLTALRYVLVVALY